MWEQIIDKSVQGTYYVGGGDAVTTTLKKKHVIDPFYRKRVNREYSSRLLFYRERDKIYLYLIIVVNCGHR